MAAYDAWDADDDWEAPPPRIFFSFTEILHLTASVVVLTLAFALMLGARSASPPYLDFEAMLRIAPLSALAVVPAFILHELAHKFVAQWKDMWAEFRANFFGLFGGFVLTAASGFLFAVPGAVHIVGNATKRDSGVISIVGPMVNLFIGYGAFLVEPLFSRPVRVGEFGNVFDLIIILNAILAGFNMLPVGPLDGRKVLSWSKLAFLGMWLLVVGLVLLYLGPLVGL